MITNIKDGIVAAWDSSKDFVSGIFEGIGESVKGALRTVGILGNSPAPVGLKIGADIKEGIADSLSNPLDINPQINAGATGLITGGSRAPRPIANLSVIVGDQPIKKLVLGIIDDEVSFISTAGA